MLNARCGQIVHPVAGVTAKSLSRLACQTGAIRRASDDARMTYLLGYYPTDDVVATKHHLKVGRSTIDYFNLVNLSGGVNGVKIGWEECETEYNPSRGVECYERLKTQQGGATLVVRQASSAGHGPAPSRVRLRGGWISPAGLMKLE